MDKGREFWLRFRRPFESMRVEGFCNKPDADSIHTIEISAVTRLQVQLEIAKAALEWTLDPCECDAQWSGKDDGEYRARGCPSCICQPYWVKVRAALAKINSLDGVGEYES